MLVFSIQRLNMFLVLRLIAIRALIPPGYLIESAKRDGSNSVALILRSLKSRNPLREADHLWSVLPLNQCKNAFRTLEEKHQYAPEYFLVSVCIYFL